VPDKEDKCVEAAEDADGFEDEDGLPRPGQRRRRVGRRGGQVPRSREDVDGFEDTDGCPDLDNDQDGIPDKGRQVRPTNRRISTARPTRTAVPISSRTAIPIRCPTTIE